MNVFLCNHVFREASEYHWIALDSHDARAFFEHSEREFTYVCANIEN